MSTQIDLPPIAAIGECLDIDVRLRGYLLGRFRAPAGFHTINSLQLTVLGTDADGSRLSYDRFHFWQSLEEIAEYVAGDGTDAMRVALADGILRGRQKP